MSGGGGGGGSITAIERQAAVLTALQAHLPPHAPLDATQACWPALQAAGLRTDAAGLRAYQLNARATAQRVLASTYPTIAAMLGDEALDVLALQLWQACPPGSGDLGEWGAGLPELLAEHADHWLAALPGDFEESGGFVFPRADADRLIPRLNIGRKAQALAPFATIPSGPKPVGEPKTINS